LKQTNEAMMIPTPLARVAGGNARVANGNAAAVRDVTVANRRVANNVPPAPSSSTAAVNRLPAMNGPIGQSAPSSSSAPAVILVKNDPDIQPLPATIKVKKESDAQPPPDIIWIKDEVEII
jgi:hypothetical protein